MEAVASAWEQAPASLRALNGALALPDVSPLPITGVFHDLGPNAHQVGEWVGDTVDWMEVAQKAGKDVQGLQHEAFPEALHLGETGGAGPLQIWNKIHREMAELWFVRFLG